MQDYLIYIISIFITLPLITSFFIYIISMIVERNKWKAIHRSVHWSTIFYIISVSIMLQLIVGHHFIGIIIILLLTILAAILITQWKIDTDVNIKRGFKLMIRIAFLLFFFLYACFFVIGIIKQIV